MARRKIVEIGDPVLRMKAAPVPEVTDSIKCLLDDLEDTLYAAKGVGLAAPQIGISKRVIVVDARDGLIPLINPIITGQHGQDVAVEGCLSIPGILGEVTRALEVEVEGWNPQGKRVKVRAKGLAARAFQHEIDHLDGILFVDKAERVFKEKKA